MPVIRKTFSNPQLFTDDDPLIVDIPQVGQIRLSDFMVNPPVEDDVSPETAPISYLVEYIVGAMHSSADKDEVKRVRNELLNRLADNSLTVAYVGDLIGEISSAYSDAFESKVSAESGRPTRRRGR